MPARLLLFQRELHNSSDVRILFFVLAGWFMIETPLIKHFLGYIDGSWVGADSGELVEVTNPASNEMLAATPNMSRVETDRAVAAAWAALKRPSSHEERADWLRNIERLLLDNKKELARIITLEQGKPRAEAESEVAYAAGFFSYYTAHLDAFQSRQIPERPRNCEWWVHHRPVGVTALITPWNFPLAMLAKKMSAALAADCSLLVKPSVKTPLTVIALFSLLTRELTLPAGKINLLLGKAGAIGDALCENPKVAKLSFTGSTEVGALLMAKAAPQLKRLSLELGGNAPFIVFADADLDLASRELIANKFRAAGQTCVCANRVLVEEGVIDDFSRRLAERIKSMKVGDGMEAGVDMGPLIDGEAYGKVHSLLQDALSKGARLVVGEDPGPLTEGVPAFFPPLVIDRVGDTMRCAHEEIFGPLIALRSFSGYEEALALANASEHGLASYVFSTDHGKAEALAAALQCGHVGINTGTGPTPEAPFGGMKRSGYGREGGLEGLQEFVALQTFAIANPESL